MKLLLLLVAQLAIALAGFAVGRLGDKIGGHLRAPHHWIYGLLLIVAGIFTGGSFWGTTSISFGLGFFLSDLNDYLHLRFYGVDEPHEWRFWSVL